MIIYAVSFENEDKNQYFKNKSDAIIYLWSKFISSSSSKYVDDLRVIWEELISTNEIENFGWIECAQLQEGNEQ